MIRFKNLNNTFICFCLAVLWCSASIGQGKRAPQEQFRVLAFYTGKNDLAHISFVYEANAWFAKISKEQGFLYESTTDWNRLKDIRPGNTEVVVFLDTRPEDPAQREAFHKYMESGGAWLGFHFAAFAMNDTGYPQNWDWYHNTFLGCGQYLSNTWKPTSAVLETEMAHPATNGLPDAFTSAPNEWYRWEKDLRQNPDIDILISINPMSFPLGTGPKPHEIWYEGDYPVVWTNKNYKMLYINMGHNDMDYEGGTNRQLSSTLDNRTQSQLIINSLLWLAGRN